MTVRRLKVIVRTPDADIPRARGFYQLEEDTLYFPIESGHGRSRYFSFIDSESVSLQLDREGRLIFIEINLPRRHWQVGPDLAPPDDAAPADIRFLDFRERFGKPDVLCDLKYQTVFIKFSDRPARMTCFLAENVLAQVDTDNNMTGLWLSGIVDDRAGKNISAWRKMLRSSSSLLAETALSSECDSHVI